MGVMRLTHVALALLVLLAPSCVPASPVCPDCSRTKTRAHQEVCIDEAFAVDLPSVKRAISRWDEVLCGVVKVTSRVVDPITEPCELTVLRVDPTWQWVQSRPAGALGWADPSRGVAWVVTPGDNVEAAAHFGVGKLLQSVSEHEVGHLLGATHATMSPHPQGCISHGAAVEAAYESGKKSVGR